MICFNCVVGVCVLCLFLAMPWVGLQSVIVAFSGQALLLDKKGWILVGVQNVFLLLLTI